ncbi:MAG TPA: porphobilinogen synthase [Spirochaetota bacterium]|nr:porphobilinogen synthase [Spirochaetota bacterium]
MQPVFRPRRLRVSQVMRDLSAETICDRSKLIMPHFVVDKKGTREAIPSMPGIEHVCIENLLRDVEGDLNLGIRSLLLFGIPSSKDEAGTSAWDEQGIVQRAVRALKERFPELCVITDVCLCEYMSHGHCGVVKNGMIMNDQSLYLLAKTALSHARAGADIVAPSDMMDGRVGAIRDALDDKEYTDTVIMSYSAKYSSAFYGPFRDAAGSAPQFGDRKTYQMDFRNAREALKEVLLDIEEGADIVMVKPALSYLDIIRRVKDMVDLPVCAYNVSGEYSMVKAAAEKGYADERMLVTEILTSIFRAGADMVISYHTREIFKNRWL